jgi:hypothetical protein
MVLPSPLTNNPPTIQLMVSVWEKTAGGGKETHVPSYTVSLAQVLVLYIIHALGRATATKFGTVLLLLVL